jgi:hypothetical protein
LDDANDFIKLLSDGKIPSGMSNLNETAKSGLTVFFDQKRAIFLSLLVLVALSSSWMFSDVTVPNERSRVYLSVAVVDDWSLSIDRSLTRFGRTADLARKDGHYYTDKAPGASLLGAGVYYVVRLFSDATDWSITELINLMRSWIMIPFGLVGFVLIRKLLSRQGISPATGDVVALGWILGTPAFHYSTAFFGHQIVAVSLMASLLLLVLAAERDRGDWLAVLQTLGAGAAAGLAGLTEYQSALPCLLLAVYAVVLNFRRPERIAAFCLGAIPFLALLLAYNWLAFGGPFELSYHHLTRASVQAQHQLGIAGVTYPTGEAAFGALFSLHRGLLTTSPILALSLPGLYFLWKKQRFHAVMIGLTMVYYFLFISGSTVWHGNWGFGLRLFVPVMAWAAIPIAHLAERLKETFWGGGLVRGLALVGLLYNQLVHVVFPELPDAATNPIREVVLPGLERGILSPNLVAELTGSPGLSNGALSLCLIFVAVCLILFMGQPSSFKYLKRGLQAVLAFALVVPLVLAVAYVEPTFKGQPQKRFLDWVERIQQKEYPGPEAD